MNIVTVAGGHTGFLGIGFIMGYIAGKRNDKIIAGVYP